jgi:hypothetical protein
LTQFLEIAGKSGLGCIGKLAAPQLIGTALQTRAEIVFIHASERAPQFGGSGGLGGRKLARRVAHLLGEARQIVTHTLAIVHHLVDFLSGRVLLRTVGCTSGILLRHQIAHLIGLLLLPGGQLIGGLGHRAQSAGGVLLLQAA